MVSISVAVAPAAGRLLTSAVANICRVVLLLADFMATLVVKLFNKLQKFGGRTVTRAAEWSLTSDAWPATFDSRDSMMVLRAA